MNSLLDRAQPYLGPVILAATTVIVLSVLGVPLLVTLGIIVVAYAYAKGYRANITITKTKGNHHAINPAIKYITIF